MNSIIVPVYNEEESIKETVEQLHDVMKSASNEAFEIIVVDDGSTDNTYLAAKENGAKVVRNKNNLGKGASIIGGILWCLDNGYQPVIIMDADGQHPPTAIPLLLAQLAGGEADVVVGSCTQRGSAARRAAWALFRQMNRCAWTCWECTAVSIPTGRCATPISCWPLAFASMTA